MPTDWRDYENTVLQDGEWRIVWNGSATFNVFDPLGRNIAAFTSYDVKDMQQAVDMAYEYWYHEGGKADAQESARELYQ